MTSPAPLSLPDGSPLPDALNNALCLSSRSGGWLRFLSTLLPSLLGLLVSLSLQPSLEHRQEKGVVVFLKMSCTARSLSSNKTWMSMFLPLKLRSEQRREENENAHNYRAPTHVQVAVLGTHRYFLTGSSQADITASTVE